MPATVYRIYFWNDGEEPDVREADTLDAAHDLTHSLLRRELGSEADKLEVVDRSYHKDDAFSYRLDGETVASIGLELKYPGAY